MLQPLQPLPPFEEFPALGEELNLIIERLNALIPFGGVGIKIKDTGAGFIIETQIAEESTPGTKVDLYTITAVNADTLTCTKVGGSTQVTIARPIHLRASGAGFTYPDFNTRRSNYQVTANTTQPLDEFVTPPYAVGDEILAADVGTTSVGANVTIEDVNADGRVWLLPKRVVGLCEIINGVQTAKKMITYGSPSF